MEEELRSEVQTLLERLWECAESDIVREIIMDFQDRNVEWLEGL